MRILLVEDDALLADAVALSLTQSAHAVDLARTGEDAERAFPAGDYGLVILDVGLPKMNGFEVLRRLRRQRQNVPVMMLTVNDSVEDRVMALDLGADDYLTKPFHLAELEARVRALIRRAHSESSSTLTHGRLSFDMAGRRLYCDDVALELSARELAVIELLLLRVGKVVTKQHIVDHLYGWEEGSTSNTVEVFIHRLRKKLEPFGLGIRTIRGMGYLVDKPDPH